MTRRVAIVGATGLLGRHLADALQRRGDEVVAVSRGATSDRGPASVVWDPRTGPLPRGALDGVDAIVNLAGEPLAGRRWTPARRAAILDSRVLATRGVAASIGGDGPTVLVNASAVGFYGPTEDVVDEDAPAGGDFLASVCVAWEREALAAGDRGRVVLARTGVVLARDGGALPPLLRVARLGVLGSMGTGRQWVPWIHVDDEVAGLVHCLDRTDVVGPVNLVAPSPVRQAELAREVRAVVHRPPTLPAPAFLVRAALGEASSVLLTGQRAVPSVLTSTGFAFAQPQLEAALATLTS